MRYQSFEVQFQFSSIINPSLQNAFDHSYRLIESTNNHNLYSIEILLNYNSYNHEITKVCINSISGRSNYNNIIEFSDLEFVLTAYKEKLE